MKWVEQAGLVQVRLPRLKTLTVFENPVELFEAARCHCRSGAIPLDDKKTYDLLARAEAVGVFQLERPGHAARAARHAPTVSRHQSRWSRSTGRARWRHPTYCARKHELEVPDYIHPKLEPC